MAGFPFGQMYVSWLLVFVLETIFVVPVLDLLQRLTFVLRVARLEGFLHDHCFMHQLG